MFVISAAFQVDSTLQGAGVLNYSLQSCMQRLEGLAHEGENLLYLTYPKRMGLPLHPRSALTGIDACLVFNPIPSGIPMDLRWIIRGRVSGDFA